MKTSFIALLATIFLIHSAPPALAAAADKYDPAALAREVGPYLDDTTLVVAHVDLTQVELRPTVAPIKQLFLQPGGARGDAGAALDQGVDAIQEWISEFTRAGGRDGYAVVSMSGFPEFPLVIVVPLRPGADGQAIAKLISANVPDPNVTTRVGEKVVLLGSKAVLDQLATAKPGERPELARAFEAAGVSTAQILYVPSADARKVLAEMLPNPTQGPLAGAKQPIPSQITSAALGARLAPELAVRIVVRSPDATSASSLADTLGQLVAVGKTLLTGELRKHPDLAPLAANADALTKAFTPAVTGDTLTFQLDADQSLTLTGIILPAVAQSREQARQMRSLSNLRQIVLASITYAGEHKNEFPPDLTSLLKVTDLTPEILRNPRAPQKEVGYVYLRPTHPDAAPSEQVVAYEAWDRPPARIAVAFADGHAEMVDYPRFEKLLDVSRERNRAK
jgi:hypothetical protein